MTNIIRDILLNPDFITPRSHLHKRRHYYLSVTCELASCYQHGTTTSGEIGLDVQHQESNGDRKLLKVHVGTLWRKSLRGEADGGLEAGN